MFYYFGYGSNLRLSALRAKGVEPISYEPAVLQDWQLCFNLPNFFRTEGGTGNITPQKNRQVHGVLYECRDEHLAILDELEALGVTYRREKKMIRTYSGRTASAYVYIGIPGCCRDGYQPSRRYMNILIRGAKDMQLDAEYLRFLEALEVMPEPVYRRFRFPQGPSPIYSLGDLKKLPRHTALAGAVFDMTEARSEHAYLQAFFEGKDMSLFFLKRMDSSDGKESFQDLIAGKLSFAQKRYLTNYLHEFDREYRFAGRMDYQLDLEERAHLPVRLPSPQRSLVPSWVVLENAEKVNSSLGHENLGFLSKEHGFMPLAEPASRMPAAFQVWDQMAGQLPHLYRSLELRRCLDSMPVLDAGVDHLSDGYLLRASALLAMLSHAYTYVETSPPAALPASLARPWQEVRRRLGRDDAVLSYIDLIVYNWRFKTADHGGKRLVEHMDLLIPTVGTRAECQFYLTQTEILAECAPLISAVVDCQEAVKNKDHERLSAGLTVIGATLQTVLQVSLPKINPNPQSPHFVDAVVWAKTVAPFAVPMQAGVQGPSGTSSPIFNLLDVFFGRREYGTFLGKEIKALRSTYPLFWRLFIASVSEISVAKYIIDSKDRQLNSLLRETVDLYAGENGFLGRHRMKVFGYLETAFKVGRSVTIGGFAGAFKDRTWDQVDAELEYSRKERLQSFPKGCHYAFVKSIGQTHAASADGVKHVVLDISHTGIRYQPGDRCGILPENSLELVEKTLAALGASGEEDIQLTDEWMSATNLRYGFEAARSLSMRDLLRFGRIRPVEPRLAEALHAVTQSQALLSAIKKRRADQWELWDLLLLLREEGYDVKRVWNSPFTSPEYISRLLPPEGFRRYSIASAVDDPIQASEIHLTVGRLTYPAGDPHGGAPSIRYGTASNFLATAAGRKEPISFILERPAQFHLPPDASTPMIMLAGGTGFAPFRGFISERLKDPQAGLSWVILGLNSREYFYYNDNFIPGLANGSLRLDVVFSREDSRVAFHKTSANNGELQYVPGNRGYAQDFLMQEAIARQLWQMLRPIEEGGQGAYLYVCGRTRFAKSCLEALHTIFARFESGSDEEKQRKAHAHLCKITAEGRFMQEVFTHAQIAAPDPLFINISEVCQRNSAEAGYWMIIDHTVYDLTKFVGMHPGGDTPIANYAGMDATQAFLRVHGGRSEIDAIRKMFEIGQVAQLDFKGVSRRLVTKSGAEKTIALATLHRAWVNTLYLVVEMQNALRLDLSLQGKSTTRFEAAQDVTFYKIQRAIETHSRFMANCVNELTSNFLGKLWQLVFNLCHPSGQEVSSPFIKESLLRKLSHVDTKLVKVLNTIFETIRASHDGDAAYKHLMVTLEQLRQADQQLVVDLKGHLHAGLCRFETLCNETLTHAAAELLETMARRIPNLFRRYYDTLHGITVAYDAGFAHPVEAVVEAGTPATEKHMVLINTYWELEDRVLDKSLILRRSPMPVTSIADLQQKNDLVIRALAELSNYGGIVVDMRQAPQRNDPEFENAMLKLRAAISSLFPRVAVLLESETGVLQVTRIGRNDGVDTYVTVNESAALRFAKG